MIPIKTKVLRFSYNWNKKLNCNCFTTLRLAGSWQEGDTVSVVLKDGSIYKELGEAYIIGVKTFYCNSINEYIARLDTGYSAAKCKEIIRRMYKKDNPLMDLLLVQYVKKVE
ncbi:MAG TPA: hypothetical protein PKD70_11205 [Saprospiraceae bacterium]|nr:hypothetical protein [Saprospiraceae bacterium]HMP14439.1 hypothetical protein [Saprospiraceae bacterium]